MGPSPSKGTLTDSNEVERMERAINQESLQCHFISVLNNEIARSNLSAYKPVSSIARGSFVSEVETSALTVGMKVNNCRENPTQGKDRSKTCPFCPGIMASLGQ